MTRIWNKHKQTNTPLKRKVFVAMSGGVDSSVVAALLKQQGYFVAGGFMKNFSAESWQGVLDADCPWEQDFADVEAVCEKLGIECRSFNFEKEYKEKVIEYFFTEYQAGRTPNPDIMCNKEIKFGLFLEKARELGFDYVATGHYAQVVSQTSLRGYPRSNLNGIAAASTPRNDSTVFKLLKGVDPKKDQSYFLYTLNQDQLSKTLFPIGHLQKFEVRKLAHKFGLPNAEKKDSQGICFIGHVNIREFLKQRIPEKVGEIVDSSGRVIGSHKGSWYYTIGQRHGLGLGGGEPYYITKKDVARNQITVTQNNAQKPPLNLRGEEGGLYSSSAILRDVHFINQSPQFPLSCTAKIRYQKPDQKCTVSFLSLRGVPDESTPSGSPRPSQSLGARDDKKIFKVEFSSPQFAIAPGQSVVFYNHETVLGGGVVI